MRDAQDAAGIEAVLGGPLSPHLFNARDRVDQDTVQIEQQCLAREARHVAFCWAG